MGCGASSPNVRDRHGDYADDEMAHSPAELRMYADLGRRSNRSDCVSADEPSNFSRTVQMTLFQIKAKFQDDDENDIPEEEFRA